MNFYRVVRSAVISQTILLRQVGVVLGPLSIFGVKQLNFTLPGGREVNQYNALGFCLTFLWLLVFILVFALYHDKGKSHKTRLGTNLFLGGQTSNGNKVNAISIAIFIRNIMTFR